jgi:general secretion pathway protein G
MALISRRKGVSLRSTGGSHRRGRLQAGFTLIEMLIVISIIGILLSIAIPSYRQSVVRAREAVLRENLYVLRSTIEQFTIDKERAPSSLEELVDEGYLRAIPRDITGNSSTWQVETSDVLISPEQSGTGISDVHSGSSAVSTEGTPYNTW